MKLKIWLFIMALNQAFANADQTHLPLDVVVAEGRFQSCTFDPYFINTAKNDSLRRARLSCGDLTIVSEIELFEALIREDKSMSCGGADHGYAYEYAAKYKCIGF